MRGRFAVVFAAVGVIVLPEGARSETTCPVPFGALVTIEGKVEFRDRPGADWRLAPLNVPLCPGSDGAGRRPQPGDGGRPCAPTYRIDKNITFYLVRAPAKPERRW